MSLENFQKETVVYLDSNDLNADTVVTFLYKQIRRSDPDENQKLRKRIGLDGAKGMRMGNKRKGEIATILLDRGAIERSEVKNLGGKIVKVRID